ncbi:MAG: hypothetical protein HYT94_04095 [Parcubacteria group bacterium]|nr:hypothetical protein [Parcubacteria group bacterium]
MYEELTELYEVTNLLLSSRPTSPVDAVFIYSRSFGGDDDGLLELVRELVPSLAPVVAINGGNGDSFLDPNHKAWPGADDYEKRLKQLGVTEILRSKTGAHTRDESEKFTDVIEAYGWTRVAVANLPQHLLRTMLGALGEVKKRNLSVDMYPVAPVCVNWRKRVNGTQGRPPSERLIQCGEEIKRIMEYPYKYPGKFASISELIQYLADLPQ